MVPAPQNQNDKNFYTRQNRKIHKARSQLDMSLDDCRELAREISGEASISSLSLRQRWELIEMLKAKGARVHNPPLSEIPVSQQGGSQTVSGNRMGPAPNNEACPVEIQEKPGMVYPSRLAYWNKRFPNPRPGYASNEQLAWIQTLWELDFNDGRRGSGLRGFIFRQTRSLPQGPVSDLAFLKSHHVKAVMVPLKAKSKQRQDAKTGRKEVRQKSFKDQRV